MGYHNLEHFNKIVKNAKSLRQKEIRLDTDKAVLLALEISEILSAKFPSVQNETAEIQKPRESLFDGGSF